MKKHCLFVLFGWPILLWGQVRHELKMDIFQPLLRKVAVAYEIVPQKRVGFELGAGYGWGTLAVAQEPPQSSLQFGQHLAQVSVAAKYYFSKHAKGDRWFVGAYILHESETYRAPGFDEAYFARYGSYPTYVKNLRTGIGPRFGFKRVFRKGLLVELGMAFDVDLNGLLLSEHARVLDLSGAYILQLGYRF
jgi:hypothetical protein